MYHICLWNDSRMILHFDFVDPLPLFEISSNRWSTRRWYSDFAAPSLDHSVEIIPSHYSDVMMSAMASQITSLTIVNWTVYSGADQRKHQSFASLAFVRGIHRWVPRTKGQLRWKYFHLMTSSWDVRSIVVGHHQPWHRLDNICYCPAFRGFWSRFGGVCSLTYCNGNFRVTMVSEPFNVIL